jgi:cytochrome c oxidase subunit 2
MKMWNRRLLTACLFLTLCTGACTASVREPDIPSALDPQGPAAANITNLWWLLFWLGTAVFVIVTALLLFIVFTHRRPGEMMAPDLRAPEHRTWIWWGGVIFPAIILSLTLFFTLRSHIALAYPPTPPALTIEVIGHMWWWEVRYPDHEVTTANEIYIPAGQPVNFRLTTNDVIHSFWVPELNGKIDMIPGKTNTLWLQAAEPGIYRGLCTEFCGLQHAKMQYLVIAVPPNAFAQWVEQQRQPAPAPTDETTRLGQQIFLGSACVYCHAIRGTNASGQLGPDLTHIASRRTLGAGILPNNRGTLGGWTINSQHIKPGNRMPPMNLSGAELQALLDYLATIR